MKSTVIPEELRKDVRRDVNAKKTKTKLEYVQEYGAQSLKYVDAYTEGKFEHILRDAPATTFDIHLGKAKYKPEEFYAKVLEHLPDEIYIGEHSEAADNTGENTVIAIPVHYKHYAGEEKKNETKILRIETEVIAYVDREDAYEIDPKNIVRTQLKYAHDEKKRAQSKKEHINS